MNDCEEQQVVLIGSVEGGGTKFMFGVGTSNGDLLETISVPTSTPEETLQKGVIFFQEKGVQAIGIGTFGPIDLDPASESYGCITKTPKPHWSGFHVVNYFKRYFNVPIGFDTDVNAAALGEATWGAAAGLASCLYMTVGTGIGAGALVEGKIIHGLTHPEMGHIPVRRHVWDNFQGCCPFHRDCLEGMASGPAIEARWGMKGQLLEQGHPVWELEAYYLAQAVVSYILILSPKKIILGGGVMKQGQVLPLIRERVKEILNGYVLHPLLESGLEDYIVEPGLGGQAGIYGALALGLEALNKK